MKARYAAIVLAAGLSTRMRRFKPLLPLGQQTITEHVISTFHGAGVEVFLVAGHRRDEIAAMVKDQSVTVIYNHDYKQGMFSSIQAGLRHLPRIYRAFFILPVDIPLVQVATIKLLMKTEAKNPGRIIFPVFRGKKGHPPLIPTSLTKVILEWDGEGGLKAALESQEKLGLEVPVADSNILFDIDTPEDYKELLKRFQTH
jgi:molybdenum cofactor cytidylyltransferase